MNLTETQWEMLEIMNAGFREMVMALDVLKRTTPEEREAFRQDGANALEATPGVLRVRQSEIDEMVERGVKEKIGSMTTEEMLKLHPGGWIVGQGDIDDMKQKERGRVFQALFRMIDEKEKEKYQALGHHGLLGTLEADVNKSAAVQMRNLIHEVGKTFD